MSSLATQERPRPPAWMRALVALAYITTPLIAIGTAMMAHDTMHVASDDAVTVVATPPVAILLGMVLAIVPGGRVSRWQRALVVVVIVQMMLFPVTAYLLGELGHVIPVVFSKTPPRVAVWLVGALAVTTLAWTALTKRRQLPRAMTTLTTFLLSYSLALALALPIASRFALEDGALRIEPILAGSAVLAIAMAVWVTSGRPMPARVSRALFAAVVVLVVVDAVAIPPMRTTPFFALLSGVHWLLAAAAVTTAAMSMLAFMQWWSLRGIGGRAGKAPGALDGTVEAAGEIVGWFTYLGMLQGMRVELDGFQLRRDDGGSLLTVPAGAAFVAPLPRAALDPKPGERIPALRAGDRVLVRGFVEPNEGGFRQHAGLVVGPSGLHVTRVDDAAGDTTSRWEEVVLAVWRPFVLYVAVATAATIPIVVALVLGLF